MEKVLLLEPAPGFEVLALFFTPEIGAILNKQQIFAEDQYVGDWIEFENRSNKGKALIMIS